MAINGHAIEARLYAEDPATGFLPSHRPARPLSRCRRTVRVDTGVEEGDEITPFYDPMIAKLIGTGADARGAMAELARCSTTVEVWPVRTNAWFIQNCLEDRDIQGRRNDDCPHPATAGRITTAPTIHDDLLQIAGDGLALMFTDGPSQSIGIRAGHWVARLPAERSTARTLKARLDGVRDQDRTESHRRTNFSTKLEAANSARERR